MVIRAAGGTLTIEAADPALASLARAAADALAGQAGEAGTIPGGLPESVSLGDVWLALRASLEDIGRRAAAASEPETGKDAGQKPAT